MKKQKEQYPIMEVGNMYFPLLYKGDKFTIDQTFTLPITSSRLSLISDFANKAGVIDFSFMAREIWSEIEDQTETLELKNKWVVLNRISKGFKKDEYLVSFDVLNPIKSKGGNNGNKN